MTDHGRSGIWLVLRAAVFAPSQTQWRTRWQPPTSRQHATMLPGLVVDTPTAYAWPVGGDPASESRRHAQLR